jgi:hypothetical protein
MVKYALAKIITGVIAVFIAKVAVICCTNGLKNAKEIIVSYENKRSINGSYQKLDVINFFILDQVFPEGRPSLLYLGHDKTSNDTSNSELEFLVWKGVFHFCGSPVSIFGWCQ